MAGAHKLPSSVAKGKHARRLLAAGVGKAQSKLGSNNKCRAKPDSAKGGLRCGMAFERTARLRLPSVP